MSHYKPTTKNPYGKKQKKNLYFNILRSNVKRVSQKTFVVIYIKKDLKGFPTRNEHLLNS